MKKTIYAFAIMCNLIVAFFCFVALWLKFLYMHENIIYAFAIMYNLIVAFFCFFVGKI